MSASKAELESGSGEGGRITKMAQGGPQGPALSITYTKLPPQP